MGSDHVVYAIRSLVVTAVISLVGLLWRMDGAIRDTDNHVTEVSNRVEALAVSIKEYNFPKIQNDLIALKTNDEWLQRQVDRANGGRRATRGQRD